MGLTARHVRRLLQRVRVEGDAGLVHRGRGKSPNQQMPEPIKAKLLMPIRAAVWRLWADVGGGAVGGTPEHYAQ